MYRNNLLLRVLCVTLFVTMIGIGELFLQPSFADDFVPCPYDFDYDGDVDGSDLAEFATEFDYELDREDLALFAQEFGKDDCLISINFTHVPEYPNPGNENLEGNVTGVNPDDYFVAVYIRVEDVWWTKPSYASPKTPMNADGTWTCDITTGGNDRYATEVAAYLLPEGVEPPICKPGCKLPEIPETVAFCHKSIKEPRTLSFAGYDWKVKRRDFPAGPGPNYFSDREEDVWVDEQGLHLTISERNDNWYGTEVILDTSFGYGSYIFQTHGRVDIIDPMMVLGLFTWDIEACEEHYRELDIEFTRWGNAGEYTNAQYVVHPCSQCPGCGDRCTRFRVDLTDEESDLTHYLVWQHDTVEFRTYYGKHSNSPPASALIHKWTYAGEDVPEPGHENVRFNFWLNQGNAPASGQGDEVVMSNFAWQKEKIEWPGEYVQVFTNLSNYPIAGCFIGAEEVRINDEPVTVDDYGGYRKDVVLHSGLNAYEIKAIRNGEISDSSSLEINYDPGLSTENHNLLYCYHPNEPETIVLDLNRGSILGVLHDINIVATTHDGRHVVDTHGNVYQTSDHTLDGDPLPFSQSAVYPVFSSNDIFGYAGTEKIRFADRILISSQFPVHIDGRFATVFPGNLLIQGSSNSFTKIDLSNDEIVAAIPFAKQRVIWGTSAVAPNSALGFVTSYSWAIGALDIINMETGGTISQFDGLSDYMGQIAFSNDRDIAFVGSYGSSYYGKGGVYVIDVGTQTRMSYYKQYGASSVVVGPDDLIYISSRFVDHFGNGSVTQGYKDRRGIDVLQLNENGELQFVKTYYLNYEHCYWTKPTFFIKPGP